MSCQTYDCFICFLWQAIAPFQRPGPSVRQVTCAKHLQCPRIWSIGHEYLGTEPRLHRVCPWRQNLWWCGLQSPDEQTQESQEHGKIQAIPGMHLATELEASWSLNDCSIALFGFHAWSLWARSHGHRINSWFLHSWFLQLLVPATAAIYLQQQHAGGKRRSKQMRRFTEKGINTIKLFFNVSKKATSIGSWKIKLLNVTAGARSIAAFRRERYGLSLKPM